MSFLLTVAERLDKLPELAADQLLQCSGLVQKLKFLIDATRSAQTVLVSITVPPQVRSIYLVLSNFIYN